MATGGKKETSSGLLNIGTLTLKSDDLHPCCINLVREKLVVTDMKSKKVHLYRCHDGMLLSSTNKLESSPESVCCVNDTDFCVAMWDGIIAIMSVQDSGLISRGKTFDLRASFNYCHGVALWNDNIVVSGVKENAIFWCCVSLQDGRPNNLHKVCTGFISYLTVKKDMAYIACNSLSPDVRGVYGFNLLDPSQLTFRYKHKELWPYGITINDSGYLFLRHWNSIYHLTGKCELVAIYKDEIPRLPSAIIWDSGILYQASSDSNVITMYETPQQQRIMSKALENNSGTVIIGGHNVTNLRFADDIDGLASSEDELATLVKNLHEISARFYSEIS